VVVALAIFAGFVALIPWLDPRMNAFWLARICAFTADQGAGRAQDVDARIDSFAERVAAEIAHGTSDEVLVVGHSIGSQVGVSVCARALRLMGSSERPISFLTLGQTIPLLGLQPGAEGFREELGRAAADQRLQWIDFSAAADGICFPLTDPVKGSGVTCEGSRASGPKLLSARYPKLFTAPTYATIKRDFYRAHFQYLMAAELRDEYDYFLITAGDKTLGRRYSHLEGVKNFDRFRTKRQ
jgi:pimeloyl-ACP methyl ester carboxylesterase